VEAIHICGWVGALTMGILSPIAYIWAYTKPQANTIEVIKQEPDL
jgi:hypothetical protein